MMERSAMPGQKETASRSPEQLRSLDRTFPELHRDARLVGTDKVGPCGVFAGATVHSLGISDDTGTTWSGFLLSHQVGNARPGAAHDVFQPGTNEVDFGAAFEEFVAYLRGNSLPVIRSSAEVIVWLRRSRRRRSMSPKGMCVRFLAHSK